jgi:hypothetical protein
MEAPEMLPSDVMLVVALLVILVGVLLMIRQLSRRMRELVRGKHRVVEETADLACQSLFLGGLALMELAQLIGHVSDRRLRPDPWLSLTASTGIVLLFGLSLGRLVMRWQLRHVLAELEIAKSVDGAAGGSPQAT